jgi:hypothetical protein
VIGSVHRTTTNVYTSHTATSLSIPGRSVMTGRAFLRMPRPHSPDCEIADRPDEIGSHCTCPSDKVYVMCDDRDCLALHRPVTFADYKLAWAHWRSHECSFGCSHGL